MFWHIINIIKVRIKYIIIPAIMLAFFITTISVLEAESGIDSALNGLNTSAKQGFAGDGNLGDSGIITDIPTGIGRIVGAILAFIGVIFFILMIYGGFMWMTARGNEQQTTRAKELIMAAVIGLIIVLAAYAITSYIGGALLTTSPS